jgi:hypothetical protein
MGGPVAVVAVACGAPVPARVGEREVRAVGDGVTTGGPHPV